MTDDDFVEVPITVGFDSSEYVGWVKVLRSKMPQDPCFTFALAFKATSLPELHLPKAVPTYPPSGVGYVLMSVAIVPDLQYGMYLKQTGVIK